MRTPWHITRQNKIIYFGQENDQLKEITFTNFANLSRIEKEGILQKIERVISHVARKTDDFPKGTLHKIKEVRNTIFCSISEPVGVEQISSDVLRLILAHTSPEDIANIKGVNTKWKKWVTDRETILSINQGINLKDALPPRIETAKSAIEWLKYKDNNACELLTYGDFSAFRDISNDELNELIDICPNLTYLNIKSNKISEIKKLPSALQSLWIDSVELRELPELPSFLRELFCYNCVRLETLPTLPLTLQKLISVNAQKLRSLPELPPFLQELICNSNLQLIALPELPSGLLTLECDGCELLLALPTLPISLQRLNCWNCSELIAIPQLPPSLKKLACGLCKKLVNLPELPLSLQSFDTDFHKGFNKESQERIIRFQKSKMSVAERISYAIFGNTLW